MSCGRCSRTFDSRHLFSWTYMGRTVPLPPSYTAALADLRDQAGIEERRRRLRLGDRVQISGGGTWGGRSGEVELVGAARVQVRIDDELVSVPVERVLPRAPAAEVARWQSRHHGDVSLRFG